jgi:hypothetical protein
MILHLSIRRSEQERLVLGFAPVGRIIFAGIALFLLVGMIATRDAPPALVILTILVAATAGYDERWIFDRQTGQASRSRGFGPLSDRLTLPFPVLKCVTLRVFSGPTPPGDPRAIGSTPGIPEIFRKGRSVLRLEVTENAQPIILEEGSHRDQETMEGLGQAIARFCNIPLYK